MRHPRGPRTCGVIGRDLALFEQQLMRGKAASAGNDGIHAVLFGQHEEIVDQAVRSDRRGKFRERRIRTGSLADVAVPRGEFVERDGCRVSHYVLLC